MITPPFPPVEPPLPPVAFEVWNRSIVCRRFMRDMFCLDWASTAVTSSSAPPAMSAERSRRLRGAEGDFKDMAVKGGHSRQK